MLTLAKKYQNLSTCTKRQVGAVVVKDGIIVSYGFNHGFHEKCNCDTNTKNPDVLHAEEMALCGFDKEVYNGANMFVTHEPCENCTKLIEKCNIKELTYISRNGVIIKCVI